MRYEAITIDGKILNNNGKGYATRLYAQKAAVRRGLVAVETRKLNEAQPHANDAAGWDAYRLSGGIASR